MQTIFVQDVFGPFLDDEAVLKIAQQRTTEVVSLAAFDCNWTPDAEKNYFNVWAAVSFCGSKDKVFLHGGRFCHWNLEYEMEQVGMVKNMGLFRLSLDNKETFPNEFVIRLEREFGEHIYDNNNFRNFSIEHDKGHCVSAIAFGTGIYSFNSIIPIQVINR